MVSSQTSGRVAVWRGQNVYNKSVLRWRCPAQFAPTPVSTMISCPALTLLFLAGATMALGCTCTCDATDKMGEPLIAYQISTNFTVC
jgi:hypothetical protein